MTEISSGTFCEGLHDALPHKRGTTTDILNILIICDLLNFVNGLNPGVISKVGWVWSSGWTWSWIGLLLLTVTDVSTTCAVVIFRVKVSCITSVDGIILWLLIWLVNYFAMLLVVCQFKPWCYWLWRLVISNWCVSIRLLSQLNSRLLLVINHHKLLNYNLL